MIQRNTRLCQRLWAAGAVLLALLSTSAAHAKGAIESISGFLQGGAEVLRIELSETPNEVPTGFSIQSPARIALDFPDVVNATGRSLIDINQGNIKSANIVQAGERSRVVLNLKQPAPYRAEVHGKTVVVLLEPRAARWCPSRPLRFSLKARRLTFCP
jgi:type IV pilus assembly protein PilQ